ncbi:MAG: type II and III secretion system protein [Limnobacter sp.]|nr:type II and III secretion system protein [Limnobacter sp.]
MADGGTVVLGGILEKSDTKSSDKVPFLGDIPILGYLFKGTSDSAEEAELLIFITPVIVQGS